MNWKRCFTDVYGEEASQLWIPKLQNRILSTKQAMQKETDEGKDQNIILITYPDQIEDGEHKLVTFEKFANRYLEGIFDVIHFLPFCPYSSDDGFSVIDYKQLADGLGTWDDLSRMAKSFTLMYDFVCNHISAKSEWFRKCLAGDEKYKTFFIEADPEEDLSKVVRPRMTPLLTKFDTSDGVKYYQSHVGVYRSLV